VDGSVYIRDILFSKWTTHELVELILDKQVEYDLNLVGIERGTTKLAIDDQMRLRMRERKISVTFDEDLTPITDKRVRARPIQGYMQSGIVFWPENNPWWETPAQNQLLRFDAAKDDDIVDALSWMGRMYQHAGRPRSANRKQKKQKSWRDQLKLIHRDRRTAMSA
jgi:predicted phage terminase large subunit-like protein